MVTLVSIKIFLEIHGNQIDSSLRGMGMDLMTDASEANMLYRPFGTVFTKFDFNDKTGMVSVLNANKDVNNIVIVIIVIYFDVKPLRQHSLWNCLSTLLDEVLIS